ncbi:hypothetical protein FHX15_002741 [Rhizobium sp. BK650]|uniref:hypothetical protein n=1 Tax=Rhizobium sp. BK650 TaxID=2586990 RepID=UPI00161207F5|nr:hypothetical protein [Rhizobium sp. BK650]MBB3657509.1 hypothetical protein [Rhizobium sp. BK650]
MQISIITELQTARSNLATLGATDRLVLVARVHSYLQEYRNDILGHVPAERCIWIERLIGSLSIKAPQIASLNNEEFRSVLSEFEKLLVMLQDLTSSWDGSPYTIH